MKNHTPELITLGYGSFLSRKTLIGKIPIKASVLPPSNDIIYYFPSFAFTIMTFENFHPLLILFLRSPYTGVAKPNPPETARICPVV